MSEKNTPEERCACVGWRANACPIHGPAPLADGVTDKNSTLQAGGQGNEVESKGERMTLHWHKNFWKYRFFHFYVNCRKASHWECPVGAAWHLYIGPLEIRGKR